MRVIFSKYIYIIPTLNIMVSLLVEFGKMMTSTDAWIGFFLELEEIITNGFWSKVLGIIDVIFIIIKKQI